MPSCSQCEKCEIKRKIEQQREICVKCPGPSDKFGTNTHIDAAPDPMLVFRHIDRVMMGVMTSKSGDTRVNVESKEAAELLLDVTAEFANLTDSQAISAVRRLAQALNIPHKISTGRIGNISEAEAVEIWDELARQNPIMASLADLADRHAPTSQSEATEPCGAVAVA